MTAGNPFSQYTCTPPGEGNDRGKSFCHVQTEVHGQ